MTTTIFEPSRRDGNAPLSQPPEDFRAALLDELSVQNQCIADADAAIDMAAGDSEDAAGAVDLHVRARARALVVAAELEAALARIDDGTYGTCERCGDRIPPVRLEAIPHTRTCVRCSAA